MKEHWLMRSYGKRRWTISGHDSVEEAKEAARKFIASGHIFPDGTRLYVESNVHIGVVYGNTIQNYMPAYDVKKVIAGYPNHELHL